MTLSERLCKELTVTVTVSRSTLPGLTQDVLHLSLTLFIHRGHQGLAALSTRSRPWEMSPCWGYIVIVFLISPPAPRPRSLRVPRLSGSPGLEMRLHRGKLALSTAGEFGEENKGRELRAGKASFPEAVEPRDAVIKLPVPVLPVWGAGLRSVGSQWCLSLVVVVLVAEV